MAYVRKTRDIFEVQGYYDASTGWEEVVTEDTRKEANIRLKEYRANQPQYRFRVKKKREKIV